MRPSPQRISRFVLIALFLALPPRAADAMTWSLFCSNGTWHEACDVTEFGQCKRHNNWGQEVDCTVANPPFPGPTDAVTIGSSGTVSLPAASVDILSLMLQGQLTAFGGAMTIESSGQIINGQLTAGSFTLAGARPLQLIGGETSRLQITNVSGFIGLELQNTAVDNDGLIKWENGTIGMSNGSSIVN
jgi:hypothetical protein